MEREQKGKPAGLRTITLITVGAALFMIVSDLVALTTEGPEPIIHVDPSRIASQVVSGIGFPGAGAIIQARGSIHGLTTAATIWVAAGIGLCVGGGFPVLGLGITFLVLLVLVALHPVCSLLNRRGGRSTIDLEKPNDGLIIDRVKNLLGSHDLPEDNLSLMGHEGDCIVLWVQHSREGAGSQRLLEELGAVEGGQWGARGRGREIGTLDPAALRELWGLGRMVVVPYSHTIPRAGAIPTRTNKSHCTGRKKAGRGMEKGGN